MKQMTCTKPQSIIGYFSNSPLAIDRHRENQ